MEIDEDLKRKAARIAELPTGVFPRGEAILVLLGEKPTAEMYITDAANAPHAINVLKSIGLHAEISTKIRRYNDGSADVLISKSTEILNELKVTFSNIDHERYGRLMGYPQSAIDAFLGKIDRLPYEEQRQELDFDFLGVGFVHSKQYVQEEKEVVKRRMKLLVRYAPQLMYDLYKKRRADEILAIIESL